MRLKDKARLLAERVEELEALRDTLADMLVRAAREVEGKHRANLLEELEGLVPGTLSKLPETMQPETIRRRSA